VIDSDANAIKVTALRTRTRGNPINLTFARAVGGSTFNVWTTATAFVRGGAVAFGIVGLDWVHIQGTTNTDSYDPTHGAYGGSNVHNGGTVASNGTITVNGTSSVHGDARPGVDSIVDINGSPTITGWTAPLDAPLSYPPAVYAAPGTNDNALVVPQTSIDPRKQEFNPGSGTTTFATTGGGARYVFRSWKMSSSGVNVVINGPATVWISGNFDMTGGNLKIVGNDTNARVIFYVNGDFKQTGGSISNPYPQRPGAFTINMTGHNTTFSASAQLNAHIYAPTSDVTLHGNANNPPADFSGWVVGQTLTLTGNSQIHYDESLGGDDGPHRAILVK
jgi:formylmethanofuran dehydrogenase subunit C